MYSYLSESELTHSELLVSDPIVSVPNYTVFVCFKMYSMSNLDKRTYRIIIMCTSSVLVVSYIPVFLFFQAVNWMLALLTIQGGIAS